MARDHPPDLKIPRKDRCKADPDREWWSDTKKLRTKPRHDRKLETIPESRQNDAAPGSIDGVDGANHFEHNAISNETQVAEENAIREMTVASLQQAQSEASWNGNKGGKHHQRKLVKK